MLRRIAVLRSAVAVASRMLSSASIPCCGGGGGANGVTASSGRGTSPPFVGGTPRVRPCPVLFPPPPFRRFRRRAVPRPRVAAVVGRRRGEAPQVVQVPASLRSLEAQLDHSRLDQDDEA